METQSADQVKSVAPRKLSKKAVEALIAESFRKHGDRIQIPIMDIPKIYQWCRRAIVDGENLDQEMQRALRMYRVN